MQGIIRVGTFCRPPGPPGTFASPLGTRGTRGVKEGQDVNVNVHWEVSDCPYKEKTPRLKGIFVANGLKIASYPGGTERSAAGTTFGDA